MEHENPRMGEHATSGDYLHRQVGGQHRFLRGFSVLPLEIFLMADQGRWFKLWVSAVSDPDLRNLSLENFGRWVLFGAYLKLHGKNGTITLVPPALALQEMLRITTFDGVVNALKLFPNCDVTHVTNSSVTILVKWKNWQKYQGDWSGDRTRRWRQKRDGQRDVNVTAKEEKRREEKRNPPIAPLTGGASTDSPERQWLTLLNRLAERSFRPVEENLRPIRARIRAGYTPADAEVVIRHKVAQWRGDPKMVEYLRPVTLFGTKFDSYLAAAKAEAHEEEEDD